MALVDASRRRAPRFTSPLELLLCGAGALYSAGWRGWVAHLSHPCEAKDAQRQVEATEAASQLVPPPTTQFATAEPHKKEIIGGHQLGDWSADGRFASGFVFVMPYSRCVA